MCESNSVSEKIMVLEARMLKAERRQKLLKCEIEDIKKNIAILKASSGDQPTSSSSSVNETICINNSNASVSSSSSSYTKRSIEVIDLCDNGRAKRTKTDTFDGDYLVVYTDGACENNGFNGAKAGIGVWFGENHEWNISRPVDGRATNNTAEIQACVAAVDTALKNGVQKLKIITDSQFVISCMTQWIQKWKRNNWKVANGGDVKNKEDLMKLDQAIQKMASVTWEHVRGHRGNRGNEEADKLARGGAVHYVSND